MKLEAKKADIPGWNRIHDLINDLNIYWKPTPFPRQEVEEEEEVCFYCSEMIVDQLI